MKTCSFHLVFPQFPDVSIPLKLFWERDLESNHSTQCTPGAFRANKIKILPWKNKTAIMFTRSNALSQKYRQSLSLLKSWNLQISDSAGGTPVLSEVRFRVGNELMGSIAANVMFATRSTKKSSTCRTKATRQIRNYIVSQVSVPHYDPFDILWLIRCPTNRLQK